MRIAKIFLLLITIAFSNKAFLQNVGNDTIRGQLIDSVTKQPLPFANVALHEQDVLISGTTTDIDGLFKIALPPSTAHKKYILNAVCEGYKDKALSIFTDSINNFIKISLVLFRSSHILVTKERYYDLQFDSVLNAKEKLELDSAFLLVDSIYIKETEEGDLFSTDAAEIIIKKIDNLNYTISSYDHLNKHYYKPTKIDIQQLIKIKKTLAQQLGWRMDYEHGSIIDIYAGKFVFSFEDPQHWPLTYYLIEMAIGFVE